jgi:hypothetical protein
VAAAGRRYQALGELRGRDEMVDGHLGKCHTMIACAVGSVAALEKIAHLRERGHHGRPCSVKSAAWLTA